MADEDQKVPAAPEAEAPKAEEKKEEPKAEAVVEMATSTGDEEAKHAGKVIKIEELRPGMTVRIHERIKDVSPKGEERERIQIFQGIIMGIRGGGIQKTMTIRRIAKGYGVEKIYPLNTPIIAKIELVKTAKVRRAKLAFLGDLRNPFKRKLKETWVETSK